jgi:putative SbcD/Mre11-related phosphoesterase
LDWLLTPEKAAVHLPTATAVIADLHLGYDRVRRRGGEAIPEFGLDETVAALGALIDRIPVRRLVIAGDLLEDARCAELAENLCDWLAGAGVELLALVPGNHDRGLGAIQGRLRLAPEGIALGEWRVVHGDESLPRGRVILGHVHPCFRMSGRGSYPCYLVRESRIILPAFSRDAAGVNVLGDPTWCSFHCHVPVGDRVLDFGEVGELRKQLRKGVRRP